MNIRGIVITFLALVFLGAGAWYGVGLYKAGEKPRLDLVQETPSWRDRQVTDAWRVYEDDKYGFTFLYPAQAGVSVNVTEYASLGPTIREACEDAKKEHPEDTNCIMRAVTKEDLENDRRQIEAGILDKRPTIGTVDKEGQTIVDIAGTKGRVEAIHSHQVVDYDLELSLFDKAGNMISIDVGSNATSTGAALRDATARRAMDSIIATFTFVR